MAKKQLRTNKSSDRMVSVLLAVALVLVSTPLAMASLYTESDGVALLDDSNFDQLVTNSENAAIVEFYHGIGCSMCQQLAPQYKKLAKSLKGLALVGAVDCEDPVHAKLCYKNGVPTEALNMPVIKMFNGEPEYNPYTHGMSKAGEMYLGSATSKAMADKLMSLYTDKFITKLASVAEAEALKGKELPQAILFTDKTEPTNMFKALSTSLRSRMAFGLVHESASEVLAAFEVKSVPQLIAIKDGSPVHYQGEFKAAAIREFLESHAAPAPAPGGAQQQKDAAGSGAGGAAAGPVQELSIEGAAKLDADEDMGLLAFYTQGPDAAGCSDELKELKKVLKDVYAQTGVNIGVVNVPADAVNQVKRYGSDLTSGLTSAPACTPHLVLLPFGEDKAEMDDYAVYDGALEAKEIQKFIADSMPMLVTELQPSNAHMFMNFAKQDPTKVGTADPNRKGRGIDADHEEEEEEEGPEGEQSKIPTPKIVLFTNKDEVPPLFRSLALASRSHPARYSFGWVRAHKPDSESLVGTFKPPKVPCIMLLAAVPTKVARQNGAKTVPGQKFVLSAQPYTGPARFKELTIWLLHSMMLFDEDAGKAYRFGDLADAASKSADAGGSSSRSSSAGAAAGSGTVAEIDGVAAFQQECVAKGGICVIGLMDGQTGRGSLAAIEVLQAAAVKYQREGALSFLTIDAAKFRSFAEALGVAPGDALPTLVALSPKRLRYSRLAEPLAAESLGRLVDAVLKGKASTQALQALPEVVAAAEDAVAGGEAAAAAEEEFDLSDIMNEEVEEGSVLSKEARMKQVEEQLKAEEEARAKAEAAKKAGGKKTTKKSKKKGKAKKASSSAKDEL